MGDAGQGGFNPVSSMMSAGNNHLPQIGGSAKSSRMRPASASTKHHSTPGPVAHGGQVLT